MASFFFRGAGRGAELRRGRSLPQLARNSKRLPKTLAGLHFVAFAILMLARAVPQFVGS